MRTVIGIFSERDHADAAIEALELEGFAPRDLSIIVKDGRAAVGDRGIKGGMIAEGALSGAATGGVLGGLAGVLIGLGAFTIPGLGVLLIGGPIATALGLTGIAATAVSAATTGVLAGGLVGSLIAVGIPDETARQYAQKIEEGAILLAVPISDNSNLNTVKNIFRDFNASQTRVIGPIGDGG